MGLVVRVSFLPVANPIFANVRDYERKQLLERVEREGATIGAQIPEQIMIQEQEIPLREFVFEIRRRESYPPGERERVRTAKRNLRRGRLQRLQRLRDEEIPYDTGEALAEEIIGIDRALNALDQLSAPDIEQQAQQETIDDTKRWVRFLKRALGQQQSNRRDDW